MSRDFVVVHAAPFPPLSFHTPPTRRYLESEYAEACAEEWHDGAQERMTWEFERVKADGSMSDSDLVNYAAELNRLFATCRGVDKHRGRGSVWTVWGRGIPDVRRRRVRPARWDERAFRAPSPGRAM